MYKDWINNTPLPTYYSLSLEIDSLSGTLNEKEPVECFKDILDDLDNLKNNYNENRPSDHWLIRSLDEGIKCPAEKILLASIIFEALINHYTNIRALGFYNETAKILLLQISRCFTSKDVSSKALNSCVDWCYNLNTNFRDPNIKIYVLTLETIMYTEFFKQHKEYSPLSNSFFDKKINKKIYLEGLFNGPNEIALSNSPHEKLWEASAACKLYLGERPKLVDHYNNKIIHKINKNFAAIILEKPSDLDTNFNKNVNQTHLYKTLTKGMGSDNLNAKAIDDLLLKHSLIPIEKILMSVFFAAAQISIGQRKMDKTSTISTRESKKFDKFENWVSQYSKTRSKFLIPAWSNLGLSLVVHLLTNLWKEKKISHDDYVKCYEEIYDPEKVLFLQQSFIKLGNWFWLQFCCSEKEYDEIIKIKPDETQLYIFRKCQGYEGKYDFSILEKAIDMKRFWRDVITSDTAISFPRPTAQRASPISASKWTENRMVGADVVLNEIPSGVIINFQFVKNFFETMVKKNKSYVDLETIMYLFQHTSTQSNNHEDALTFRDLHKFCGFVIYTNFISLLHPECLSQENLCLHLFEKKSMDFRGRLYSTTVASVTASQLYRVLYTSGQGATDIRFVVASMIKLLKKMEYIEPNSSVTELYEMYLNKTVTLLDPHTMIESGALKDYRTLWQYAYSYWVLKSLEINSKLITPFSIQVDCTSSVFQYVAGIMHDTELGRLTNSIGKTIQLGKTIEDFVKYRPEDLYEWARLQYSLDNDELWEYLGGVLKRQFFKGYMMTKGYCKSDMKLEDENINDTVEKWNIKNDTSRPTLKSKVVIKNKIVRTLLKEAPPHMSPVIIKARDVVSHESSFKNKIMIKLKQSVITVVAFFIKTDILVEKREQLEKEAAKKFASAVQAGIKEQFNKPPLSTIEHYSKLITLLRYRYTQNGGITWKYNFKNNNVDIEMKYLKLSEEYFDRRRLTVKKSIPGRKVRKEGEKYLTTLSKPIRPDVRATVKLLTPTNKVDTSKQLRAIVPNFTHSLDSMLLHKVCYKWFWGAAAKPEEKQQVIDKLVNEIYAVDKGLSTVHDCFIVHPADLEKLLGIIRSSYCEVIYTAVQYLHQILSQIKLDLIDVLSLKLGRIDKICIYGDISFKHFLILCSDGLSSGAITFSDQNWSVKDNFSKLTYGRYMISTVPVQNAIERDSDLLNTCNRIKSMDDSTFGSCVVKVQIYSKYSKTSIEKDLKLVNEYLEHFDKHKHIKAEDYLQTCGWLVALK